ncbi:YlbF family regulator [Christensenellaceae bacterium OttesenSCG-928-L17]|nr:YlbF family regulator [Christensenellaceae bacterium OttesenSCG-928-L17]
MILNKARELGIALSETEEFQRMGQARAVMEADQTVTDAMALFQAKQDELVALLSNDSPDRLLIASLSHEVEALQTQLLENPVFAEALEAQNAFQQMMNAVNREIGACIGAVAEEEAGCSGSCEGCAGCSH